MRWPLDHEQRKLAEESARAGSRLSTARLELERLTRADEQSRAKREQSYALVAQREEQRFEQEKVLETMRAEIEGSYGPRAEFERGTLVPPDLSWPASKNAQRAEKGDQLGRRSRFSKSSIGAKS